MSKNISRKIKLLKIFKAIILVCIIVTLFISISSCKEAPAVVEEQQEEEGEVTIPSETKEETNETPPVVEEEPQKAVEWEGITINPIEGLRFDDGSFYPIDNRYNIPLNTEAGKVIIDAFEFNGKLENTYAFRPEFIEALHNKILNEEGQILVPLPIDFTETRGVKIDKVKYMHDDEDKYPFKDTSLLINAPMGTKIYSPLRTTETGYPDSGFGASDSSSEPNDGFYSFYFGSDLGINANPNVEEFTNPFKYEGFEVPLPHVVVWCQGVELSPQTFQGGNIEVHPLNKGGFGGSSEFGTELAEIISQPKQELGQPPFFSDICSAEMYLLIDEFGKNKRKVDAENIILEIDGIKVSILPVHD